MASPAAWPVGLLSLWHWYLDLASHQPGFKGLKGTLTKDTKDTRTPWIYDGLWMFMVSTHIIGGNSVSFFSPDYDSSKSQRNPWFLGTNTSFRCSPPHPDPRRIWEGGSCTMEAAWIYGGSRHRKKVLETGFHPTIIMILVDLQFGGSIPTISGYFWWNWVFLDVYSLWLALPCSAMLCHIPCFLQASKNEKAAAMILLSPGTTISGGIWPRRWNSGGIMNPCF